MTRDGGSVIFDPDEWKGKGDELKMAQYALPEEQLRSYAELATQIRKRLKDRADTAAAEENMLSDETIIAGTTWADLKATAMKPNYKTSADYVSIPIIFYAFDIIFMLCKGSSLRATCFSRAD